MFHKLQAKAQAALASATHRNDNNDQTDGQTDPIQPTQQPGGRHHAIDNITHTLKQLHTQYSPQVRPDARQLQLLITSQKGLALDFEAVSRESKGHSKELYLWGQDQVDDVKDVSDRVAYLNFAHGSLAADLAKSLDSSRASYKSLRDAETALHPRRTARAGMKAEIDKIKQAGATGKAPANGAERIAELETQLKKAEQDDTPQEREVVLLKRRSLIECERKKWAAFREYAAKLEFLADAAEALLEELPEKETTGAYAGAQNTARIRSQLQNALDSYQPVQGRPNKFKAPHADPGVGIGADTRSFGETHKDELNSLPPTAAPTPTPTPQTGPGALAEQRFGPQGSSQHLDSASSTVTQPGSEGATRTSTTGTAGYAPPQPTPINPTALNHAPTSLPTHSPSVSSPLRDTAVIQDTAQIPSTSGTTTAPPPVPVPSAQNDPTVAETGVPLTAGAEGPGPKSGSLSRDNVPTVAPPAGLSQAGTVPPAAGDELPGFAGATKHESAEEEKARLAREERERLLHSGNTSTAEEEKARLEREERDRLLRGQDDKGQDGKPVLPPYADY